VIVIVVIIVVLALLFLNKGQQEKTETRERGQTTREQTGKSDEEAYRRTLGKYGIHGGGDLDE
jgi:hypothetical protein